MKVLAIIYRELRNENSAHTVETVKYFVWGMKIVILDMVCDFSASSLRPGER